MVRTKDPAEIESAHARETRARDDDVGMTAECLGQPFRAVLRYPLGVWRFRETPSALPASTCENPLI